MNRIEQFESDFDALNAMCLGVAAGGKVLILRHQQALFAYSFRLCQGDQALAEDMVQDTFLKLWKSAPKLLEAGEALNLRPWLYRVLRNHLIDIKRKNKPMTMGDDLPEMEDESDSALEVMEKEGRAKAVQNWLFELPERQRTALILSHFEAMSNPEIAEILDISVEAVESLLARGRRSMAARAQSEKEDT